MNDKKKEYFTESTLHLHKAAISKWFELEGHAWSRIEDNSIKIKKLS